MMQIYQSIQNKIRVLDESGLNSNGIWVDLLTPTEDEIQLVAANLSIDIDFVRAALDEEERSRIEVDDETGNMLIVVDLPYVNEDGDDTKYETFPIGIIISKTAIVTVSLKNNIVIDAFVNNNVKTFYTNEKSRFVLQILYRMSTIFLQNLKQLEKKSNIIQKKLYISFRNKELLELMELEKSLVYFSTSLKSNEIVLERLLRTDFIRKYPEDKELLEDTIIENKQAIEMSKIYSDILSGTMDAYASIVSNNLSIVMKYLAAITIILSIPTMISSFLGMNVVFPFSTEAPYIFYIIVIISIISAGVVAIVMKKNNML